ncbi:FAD dependent oxidoreductase [Thelonectria olida]|uniref:FAD dependent oxidoreductase n=1 Tax=Thelonectria olida TaxID=1576542 RepID=A0A9P9ASA2_9HYPO|nr:FAD dependent oxidoreductase [Thelonectria olida]
MAVPTTDPILVIGGGAFGISTVFHLLNAGYSDITVLDKDEEIPSRFSAANDLNKIVRAEYEDPFYTDLTLKAIEAWKTPLFAPHFHQVGFLHCVSGKAPVEALDTLNRFRASAERHPKIKKKVVPLDGADTIRDLVWQYQESSLSGWHGYLNTLDGYAHSGNAVKGLYDVVRKRGVKFILGKDGAVAEIVYEKTAQGKKTKGVKTASGHFLPAGLIIVAAGAAASRLIPEIGSQLVAKSWSVAHVHLTDDETSALRGIPVTYARDLGFFFEPDPKTNLLKLCPMGGGYINTDPKTGVSHAPGTIEESAFLPKADEAQLRKLLSQTLPHLADRPLVKKSLCWFADTKDSDFIVDYVPGTDSSVVMLSGDSGHGFKMFPIVGDWVKNLLTATDGKQPVARWRWKTPAKADEGNWGAGVSWRLGASLELADIKPTRDSKL